MTATVGPVGAGNWAAMARVRDSALFWGMGSTTAGRGTGFKELIMTTSLRVTNDDRDLASGSTAASHNKPLLHSMESEYGGDGSVLRQKPLAAIWHNRRRGRAY
jgi:hypothetical protein